MGFSALLPMLIICLCYYQIKDSRNDKRHKETSDCIDDKPAKGGGQQCSNWCAQQAEDGKTQYAIEHHSENASRDCEDCSYDGANFD